MPLKSLMASKLRGADFLKAKRTKTIIDIKVKEPPHVRHWQSILIISDIACHFFFLLVPLKCVVVYFWLTYLAHGQSHGNVKCVATADRAI